MNILLQKTPKMNLKRIPQLKKDKSNYEIKKIKKKTLPHLALASSGCNSIIEK